MNASATTVESPLGKPAHQHSDDDHHTPTGHHHHHTSRHTHCCHHDVTDTGLKQRLFLVLTAIVFLIIGGTLQFVRPDQREVSALFGMIGSLLSALPIIRDTLTGLQSKASENSDFYMNQFMTLAVVACLVSGHYFTGGVVAIILLLGHILEDRSMLGASEAINSLLNLSKTRARRLTKTESEEEIDADLLVVGDRIRVRPGDIIPADGRVQKGHSAVNQANITGESFPVEVSEGINVFAGTLNMTGMVQIEVTRTGDQTVLGRVQHIVEEAQSTRAPIIRLTEEYARYYMPFILLIAGAVLFFTHDFQRAISVIIVSIPCAFVMAGPTAMVAALASASRLGILIKSVRFFEVANDIDTVVFDKTGTLTTGQLQVAKVDPAKTGDANRLLALAAALEQHSTHPLAQAIVRASQLAKISIPEAVNIHEAPGLGVSGVVGDLIVCAGRSSWLREKSIDVPEPQEALSHYSAISIAVDEKYQGAVYFSDTARLEITDLKARLEDEGIEHFVMLTGDRKSVAQDIADQVGITEFQAECLPEQKLAAVEKLKQAGRHVLIVGDGVNDAPALAAGHLSMAMGSLGSDMAIQTADVALMSSDLRRVTHFLQLANLTLRAINQNMLCGFVFIGMTVILSGTGYIPPIAAAFVHELGAFFVIFNSARLLKFEGTAIK